jgi:hypothetical protein
MSRSARRRPSASLVVASLALVVACTGSGYAAGIAQNSVGTAQLKTNAVTSVKVANNSLTGADVKESALGPVPRAGNATTVGGVPASGLLRTSGCQRGKVLGFVRVRGRGLPISEVYSTAGLEIPYNCAGGVVEMRHLYVGEYVVRFVGNVAEFAFAQVLWESFSDRVCASVRKSPITPTDPDGGSFIVLTYDCRTGADVDTDLTLLLP